MGNFSNYCDWCLNTSWPHVVRNQNPEQDPRLSGFLSTSRLFRVHIYSPLPPKSWIGLTIPFLGLALGHLVISGTKLSRLFGAPLAKCFNQVFWTSIKTLLYSGFLRNILVPGTVWEL